jgi:hypothetical protein
VRGTFKPAFLRDTDGDGTADNTRLTATQVTQIIRNGAGAYPILMDPPGMIVPGDILQTNHVTKVQQDKNIPDYLELSEIETSYNASGNKISFDHTLFDLVLNEPNDSKFPLNYWALIDSDNNKSC